MYPIKKHRKEPNRVRELGNSELARGVTGWTKKVDLFELTLTNTIVCTKNWQ